MPCPKKTTKLVYIIKNVNQNIYLFLNPSFLKFVKNNFVSGNIMVKFYLFVLFLSMKGKKAESGENNDQRKTDEKDAKESEENHNNEVNVELKTSERFSALKALHLSIQS